MKFSFKHSFKSYRVSLVIGPSTHVQGVNSNLRDGGHILMWDFDNLPYEQVKAHLWVAQTFHALPAIHISKSSENGGYHAYCLKRFNWLDSLHIVSGTKGVDPEYVRLCAMRAHWTLRLSDKGQGAPQFVETIPSGWPETVRPDELNSYVDYTVWATSHILTPGSDATCKTHKPPKAIKSSFAQLVKSLCSRQP